MRKHPERTKHKTVKRLTVTPVSMKAMGLFLAVCLCLLAAAHGFCKDRDTESDIKHRYYDAIQKTANMVSDGEARRLVQKAGLNILNITWEDTGRYKNSSVGPNISDMTIQVMFRHGEPRSRISLKPAPGLYASVPGGPAGRLEARCMPVIRYDNFSDRTADLDPRDFVLLVGNEKGKDLKRISLYDFLVDPTRYLHHPRSWKAREKTLFCDRDGKVLVSAQACFLPVPRQGEATFNPVLFNYQSTQGDPAVLTILATREGTSVTVIDNVRNQFEEGGAWGQRLFFNQDGQRASLTGERESEFKQRRQAQDEHQITPQVIVDGKSAAEGLNMVLLIQVPLKQKNPRPMILGGGYGIDSMAVESASVPKSSSDVENAVIGHGALEGPFVEIDDLDIERDERFPVRVTVQFYKATSNGVVSSEDIRQIKKQIDHVYDQSDYVGSLVTAGNTGRITEYEGAKVQPSDWWVVFWDRHERNTGEPRALAVARLRQILGRDFQKQAVTDLYLNLLLR